MNDDVPPPEKERDLLRELRRWPLESVRTGVASQNHGPYRGATLTPPQAPPKRWGIAALHSVAFIVGAALVVLGGDGLDRRISEREPDWHARVQAQMAEYSAMMSMMHSPLGFGLSPSERAESLRLYEARAESDRIAWTKARTLGLEKAASQVLGGAALIGVTYARRRLRKRVGTTEGIA